MGRRVKRAPNHEPMAVAMAKNQGVQRELWNSGKERRQVTAHCQTCAKTGDNTANDGLHNADTAARHAQFDIVGPQRCGKTAAKHTEDHHSVDAG